MFDKKDLNDDTDIYLVPYSDMDRCEHHGKYNKSFNYNEFIGEELCKNLNIPCTHYFLVGYGYFKLSRTKKYGKVKRDVCSFGVGSDDFKERGKKYFTLDNDYSTNLNALDDVLALCPSKENKKELLDEVTRMFALDIYMGQVDRYKHNVTYYKDKSGNIHLAPLYDFERSFWRASKGRIDYGTDLYDFCDNDKVYEFMEDNPKLRYELEKYTDIDLVEVASKSYNDRGIKLNSEYADYLDFMSEDRRSLVKKLVK